MSRRGTYRGIFSSLLDDPDYQRLSPDARLVLLTLRLSAQAGIAAIFRFYVAVVAEQTGLDVDAVEKALAELSESPSHGRPWIYREGGVVWVRNGLRYDPNVRRSDEKHMKGIIRAVEALPRLEIVAMFCRYYEIESPFGKSSETRGRGGEDHSPPISEPENDTETESRPSGEGLGRPSPNGAHTRTGFREVKL